jgi:hypothetical protein
MRISSLKQVGMAAQTGNTGAALWTAKRSWLNNNLIEGESTWDLQQSSKSLP